MGVRFFKNWLLFWHTDFERIKTYKYFRISIFGLRYIFILLLIIFWGIVLYEEREKSSFEVAEDIEVSEIMTEVFVIVCFIIELLITVLFYLYSQYITKKNQSGSETR